MPLDPVNVRVVALSANVKCPSSGTGGSLPVAEPQHPIPQVLFNRPPARAGVNVVSRPAVRRVTGDCAVNS